MYIYFLEKFPKRFPKWLCHFSIERSKAFLVSKQKEHRESRLVTFMLFELERVSSIILSETKK